MANLSMPDQNHRLRLKLPTGAELEAEGSAEFVRAEREEFLVRIQAAAAEAGAAGAPAANLGLPNIDWEAITEIRGQNIQLRSKLRGEGNEKDACLVLMGASQKLLNLAKPTAAQLAKWLRSSGYPIQRMDRALQDGVARGEILASGSRRARRYELTAPGRLKAHILANQLTAVITGQA
jgi:hypothetical protein